MLLLGDNLSGERIFEWFFGADVEARENEYHCEQPQRVRAGAKENRGDYGEQIARGEHRFAAGHMVAQPATEVSRAYVEDVVQSGQADVKAGGAGHAVSRREHS